MDAPPPRPADAIKPTLVEYYGDETKGRLGELKSNFADARQAAEDARQAARDAQGKFNEAQQTVDQITARIAAVQRLLPIAATRPDGDELLDDLEALRAKLLIARRRLLGTDGIRQATAVAADIAALQLNRLDSARNSAKAASAEAAARQSARTALVEKLAKEPLASLRTKADEKPVRDLVDAAQTRVNGDLPAILRVRALALRRKALADRKKADDDAEHARVEYLTATTSQTGVNGAVVQARDDRDRADAVLQRYVVSAPGDLAGVVASLARIADSGVEPLTPAERADLFPPKDAPIVKARSDAANIKAEVAQWASVVAAQKDLADATAASAANPTDEGKAQAKKDAATKLMTALSDFLRIVVSNNAEMQEALAKLDAPRTARNDAYQAWLGARATAKNSGAQNVDDDPSVQAAKAVLDQRIEEYRNAVSAYKASPAGLFGEWLAAVPEAAWRRFFDLEDLKLVLTHVKETDPDALASAAVAADAALAAAVQIADTATDSLAAKQDGVTVSNTVAAIAATNGQDRPNP